MDLIDTQTFGFIIAFLVAFVGLVIACLKRFPNENIRRSTQKTKVPVRLEDHDQPSLRNRRPTTIPRAATPIMSSVGTQPPRPPSPMPRAPSPPPMPHSPTTRALSPAPKAPTPTATPPTSTQRVPSPSPRAPTPTPKAPTPTATPPTSTPRAPTPTPRAPTSTPRAPTPTPRAPTPTPRAPTPTAMPPLSTPRAPTPTPRAPTPPATPPTSTPRAPTPMLRAPSPTPRVTTPATMPPISTLRAPSPTPRAPTPPTLPHTATPRAPTPIPRAPTRPAPPPVTTIQRQVDMAQQLAKKQDIVMAHEVHLKNNKYRQWVKAGLGLGYLKEGLAPFCDDIGKQQHKDIINQIQGTKTPKPIVPCVVCQITTLQPDHVRVSKGICPLKQDKCNCCFPNNKKSCPNNICGAIYDSIIQNHASIPPAPFWRNSDAHDWSIDPWSICKCFINAPGYKDKISAADVDCSALLHVIINNKYFHNHIGCNVTGPNNLFAKVRQYRNAIFHSSCMELEETEANSYIDDIISILQDGKDLVHHQAAQRAVRKLQDLKKKDFIITTDGFEEVLGQIKEEMTKVLKSIENAATKEEYNELKNNLSDLETKMTREKEVQLCFYYL